jgi:hypothetical protein
MDWVDPERLLYGKLGGDADRLVLAASCPTFDSPV